MAKLLRPARMHAGDRRSRQLWIYPLAAEACAPFVVDVDVRACAERLPRHYAIPFSSPPSPFFVRVLPGTNARTSMPQGADTIHRLVRNGAAGHFKIHGEIKQPAGSGPRHIAVRGNQLYTIHETASTLTQQTIPRQLSVSTAKLVANVSVIPPGLPAGAKMFAAEILLAEKSKKRGSSFARPYIYVSNRNLGTQDARGDAIAIYQVEPKLKLVKHVYTGLDQIRGMELSGGPENAFIVAAGVAGTAGTVVLKRTKGGADLEVVARNTEIPTRTSFVWLQD